MAQPAAAHWCDSAGRPTKVERAICGDANLVDKDIELNQLYAALGGHDNASMKAAQRQWMTGRNLCGTMECLHGYYDDRLRELRTMAGGQPTPAPVPLPSPQEPSRPARSEPLEELPDIKPF